MNYFLNIGDVVASRGTVNFTCFGLGSCIGLFLQDRLTGISGGAHIFLPEKDALDGRTDKFYDVTSALEELLKQFRLQGSTLEALRAKMVGGANVLESEIDTGERNIQVLRQELIARKIFIAATDVGGKHCRTVRFEGQSGQLTVKIPQIGKVSIY